jgi:glutamyl-tRNA reductase
MQNGFKLSLIGINHKTSSVEEREKYQINKKDLKATSEKLHDYTGLESILILSTCNRLEFYIVHEKEVDPFKLLEIYYTKNRDISVLENRDLFYFEEDYDATSHLFRVICGLESLVLGEYQIQGQVRDAYSTACDAKTLDKIMHKLFHAAFRVGKKSRSMTAISEGKQSVSGVASKIIIEHMAKNAKIAIIGVNESTKIFAQELVNVGYHNFEFINRTSYKAEMMAEQFGGVSHGLDELEKVLFDSDAVFSCTGAKGFVVSCDMLERLKTQERLPEYFIDMAVPRDIDVACVESSVKSFDIGDLQHYLDEEEKVREHEIPKVEEIIQSETSLFREWSDSQGNELMAPYAEKFEMIRQQLLEENKAQFSMQAYEKVEKLSRNLMHRLQSNFMRILIKQQTETRNCSSKERQSCKKLRKEGSK